MIQNEGKLDEIVRSFAQLAIQKFDSFVTKDLSNHLFQVTLFHVSADIIPPVHVLFLSWKLSWKQYYSPNLSYTYTTYILTRLKLFKLRRLQPPSSEWI